MGRAALILLVLGVVAVANAQTFNILNATSTVTASQRALDFKGVDFKNNKFDGACYGTDLNGNTIVAGGRDDTGAILNTIYVWRSKDKAASTEKNLGALFKTTQFLDAPLAYAGGVVSGNTLYCVGGVTSFGNAGDEPTYNTNLYAITFTLPYFLTQSSNPEKISKLITVTAIDASSATAFKRFSPSVVANTSGVVNGDAKTTLFVIGGLSSTKNRTLPSPNFVIYDVTAPGNKSTSAYKFGALSSRSNMAQPTTSFTSTAANATFACSASAGNCPGHVAFPGAFWVNRTVDTFTGASDNTGTTGVTVIKSTVFDKKIYLYSGINAGGSWVGNSTAGFVEYDIEKNSWSDPWGAATGAAPWLAHTTVVADFLGINVVAFGGSQNSLDTASGTGIYYATYASGKPTGFATFSKSLAANRTGGVGLWSDDGTDGNLYAIGGGIYANAKALLPATYPDAANGIEKFQVADDIGIYALPSGQATLSTTTPLTLDLDYKKTGKRLINGQLVEVTLVQSFRQIFQAGIDLSAYGGSLDKWVAAVLDPWIKSLTATLAKIFTYLQDGDISIDAIPVDASRRRNRKALAHSRKTLGTLNLVNFVVTIVAPKDNADCGRFAAALKNAFAATGSPLAGFTALDSTAVKKCNDYTSFPVPVISGAAATSPLAFVASAVLALAALLLAL